MQRLAIIDLGTNTFHLLVAEITGKELKVLRKEKKSVKIGEGGISQGKITPPAQERAIRTLMEFRQVIDDLGASSIFAHATSAFRNADNGKALVLEILEKTGIQIKIIDGQQEAQFIYQGVKLALDIGPADSLILDIGGGSVEFIIANSQTIQWVQSFEIGAQRLMDKFHHQDPITTREIRELESFLDQKLAPLFTAMENFHPKTLIGASGTFDTLSQIYSHRKTIATDGPERLLSIDEFGAIHQEIIRKNRDERMAIPGMIEMRVDMIVVASSLIDYLLKRFSFDNIRVSSYALKEGVLSEVTQQSNLD